MATHSSILPWKAHGQRSLVGCSSWGFKESNMTWRLNNNDNLNHTGKADSEIKSSQRNQVDNRITRHNCVPSEEGSRNQEGSSYVSVMLCS